MFIQAQPDFMYEWHKLLIEGAVFLFALITIAQLLWLKLKPKHTAKLVSSMKHGEHDRFCFVPLCIVSYVDLDGVRHSVEVEADGLFEAAVLGIAAFKKQDLTPGGLTELQVELRSSITHGVTIQKVEQWLQRGVRTPEEAILKERLKALL